MSKERDSNTVAAVYGNTVSIHDSDDRNIQVGISKDRHTIWVSILGGMREARQIADAINAILDAEQ